MEVLSIEIYEVVYVLSTLISIQLFRQISKRRTCTTQVLMLSLKTKRLTIQSEGGVHVPPPIRPNLGTTVSKLTISSRDCPSGFRMFVVFVYRSHVVHDGR